MDNLSARKAGRVRNLIEGTRLRVRGRRTDVRKVVRLGLSDDKEYVESTVHSVLK
jgi:hypothetical protein